MPPVASALDGRGTTPPTVGAAFIRLLLLAAFPLSLTSPGTTVAMALSALCGLYLWARIGTMPRDIAYAGAVAAGGYLLLVCVDFANGGGLINLAQTGVNYLPVLALAPLALAIRLSGVTVEMVDRALQATIVLAILISAITWLEGEPRPGGLNLNPIPYGFAILLSATLLLWRGVIERSPLSLTLALLATVPMLLTGSKIVWACAILSYAGAFAYWTVVGRRWSQAGVVALVVAVCLAIFYFTYAGPRLAPFWAELRELADTGMSMGGSFGFRMEATVSGWRAFLNQPILGYGFEERMAATFANRTPGGPDVMLLGHLHNDYITHLVSYGVFGGFFLASYLVFFWQQAIRSAVPAYRLAGVALAVLLALYMTAEIAFNMDPVSGPLAMYLALLTASRVHLGRPTSEAEHSPTVLP